MAEFRSINTEMWRADDWFQALPMDARLFWVYLFTNPSASVSGIYKLPLRTMAFESGLTLERVTELLAQFADDGKAFYQSGIIWVRKMRDHQLPGRLSPKLATHLNKEIDKIPDGHLKREYLKAYGYSMDTVSIPRATDTDTHTEPDTDTDTHTIAPAAREDPASRAVNNAYDACGLMITKTHLDAHLDTIKRTGLPAWQSGWAAAMEAGKQNRPAYVARCAESAMLAEQKSVRSNGHGKSANSQSNFGLASLTTDADRAYHAANTPEAIAALQAEFDAARAAREARGVS